MNYQETINYLFNSTPIFEKVGATAYKEGLYNTYMLDEHFGHPHQRYKTVHVAGTNGKGSCSHTIAAILHSAGYRVGLYTSPHLVDFRERIRVDGNCIDEQYVIDFVEKEKDFFEPLKPSFFELTTAMAFKYFADQNVDIAVIEVGLGGRLDCTNIITPILSVITNISLDHTQFLGNTIEKIATEKAGIIKSNVPVVIGETTPGTYKVFAEKANESNAPIIFAEEKKEVITAFHGDSGFIEYSTVHFGTIKGELLGEYQEKNTNTILAAIKVLMEANVIDEISCVKKGFSQVCEITGLEGRWQKLQHNPLVICDTGHNVGGWKYIADQIRKQHCETLRIVFGMVDDKDLHHVMDMLPQNATYYFTKATTKRAIPETEILREGEAHGLHGKSYSSVKDAYLAAINDATPNDFIFIGGSSYIVADLLTFLKRND